MEGGRDLDRKTFAVWSHCATIGRIDCCASMMSCSECLVSAVYIYVCVYMFVTNVHSQVPHPRIFGNDFLLLLII